MFSVHFKATSFKLLPCVNSNSLLLLAQKYLLRLPLPAPHLHLYITRSQMNHYLHTRSQSKTAHTNIDVWIEEENKRNCFELS